MNVVVLSGRLSSAPVRRELASGTILLSLEVTTDTADGVVSVPVAWFDPPPAVTLEVGSEVVVRGVVRRRFFRAGSVTQSRTEVVADGVVDARRRRSADKLVASAVAELRPG